MEMAADRELTDQIFKTFFATIELLLRGKSSLVAEAAFQHNAWSKGLEPLREIADIRIIFCNVIPPMAQARQQMRSKQDPLFDQYHPLPLGHKGSREPFEVVRMEVPILVLDTTNEPNLAEALEFLK